MRRYTSFGNANVFSTVILPINERFHFFQVLREFLIGWILFIILHAIVSLGLLQKVIPNDVAWVELQLNCFFFQNSILVSLRDHKRKMVHFVLISVRPDICPKLSNVEISFSKLVCEPFVRKQASGKSVCFVSICPIFIPLMF